MRYLITQIEAQRSWFDLKRRSSGVQGAFAHRAEAMTRRLRRRRPGSSGCRGYSVCFRTGGGKPRFAKLRSPCRVPYPNRSLSKHFRFGTEEPLSVKSLRAQARKRRNEARDEAVRPPEFLASASFSNHHSVIQKSEKQGDVLCFVHGMR